MATELYRVLNGLGIFGQADILSGDNAPGGDSSFQDAARLGSLYLRESPAALYLKTGAANTTADWVTFQTSSGGGGGIAPVNVADSTLHASVAATTSAYDASNTIDGVTISSGFRVLLTNLTSGIETAYTITGTTGAWTLTADSTPPSVGNEIYVEQGATYAGDIFVFDGSNWNLEAGESILDELSFIRSFIGKLAAGSSTPNYSSTTFVTDGTSLVDAISALDAGLTGFGSSASSTNITSVTTVDTVNVKRYNTIKWFISCIDHSAPSNKQSLEIFATHDATPLADAANVDFNLTSLLTMGVAPSGVVFTVTLSGSGGSQVMNLRAQSSGGIDVKVARITV